MADPRRPVHRVTADEWNAVGNIVHKHLIECARRGSSELRCTGGSFVTMGIGMWAAELAELDGAMTARFLHALADILDPASTPDRKREAEGRRKHAVVSIMASLDTLMASPEGRA